MTMAGKSGGGGGDGHDPAYLKYQMDTSKVSNPPGAPPYLKVADDLGSHWWKYWRTGENIDLSKI
jgi:hypothetical protein